MGATADRGATETSDRRYVVREKVRMRIDGLLVWGEPVTSVGRFSPFLLGPE